MEPISQSTRVVHTEVSPPVAQSSPPAMETLAGKAALFVKPGVVPGTRLIDAGQQLAGSKLAARQLIQEYFPAALRSLSKG